jgi:hypothetical protein
MSANARDIITSIIQRRIDVQPLYVQRGDGSDDSARLQRALDSGRDILLEGGTYNANNLTQSTNQQRILALGNVLIIKNANGPIITCAGFQVELNGIQFRGEASSPTFTGDNVVMTGDDPVIINCGSRYAFGRALKCTGSHVQVIGRRDIYQTADATATGFDIELGASNALTLYHLILGVVSTQNTGGIKSTDCGNLVIDGCQFGKLHIAKGTGPAGTNGGNVSNCRILGNVTVEISSATVTNNHFGGAVAITLAAGTSGCRFDDSNSYDVGCTITNNGNVNNYIAREVSGGSVVQIKYGDDASAIVLTYNPGTGATTFPHNVTIPNNRVFGLTGSGGGANASTISQSAGDNLAITNTISNAAIQYSASGASGIHQFVCNGTEYFRVSATKVRFLNHSTTTTAPAAGGAGALPATPKGYVTLNVNGTDQQFAYY